VDALIERVAALRNLMEAVSAHELDSPTKFYPLIGIYLLFWVKPIINSNFFRKLIRCQFQYLSGRN